MAERMTLEEFDIYREVRNLRIRADASRAGRAAFSGTMAQLAKHSEISERGLAQAATAAANKAEATHIAEAAKGNRTHFEKMGIGLSALFNETSAHFFEFLENTFVAVPPELRGASVVEVDVPGSVKPVAGLILPDGIYSTESAHPALSQSQETVLVWPKADMSHGFIHPASAYTVFQPWQVRVITDSAGAHWAPGTQRR